MDPDLLPSLISYYQQSQCTKDIGFKIEIRKHARHAQKLEAKAARSLAEQQDLRAQIEELKVNLSEALTNADVRQREVESLRTRHQGADKADKAHAQSLKAQADSYKREIAELKDDLKLRDEELGDLRNDSIERDTDLQEARELTRTREKELKETRDQLRARESDIRKVNHKVEKLQATVQRLEIEVSDGNDALEASKEALVEAEERLDALQAQKQILNAQLAKKPVIAKPNKPVVKKPIPEPPSPAVDMSEQDQVVDEESEPPSPEPVKPVKKKSAATKPVSKPVATKVTDPATDYTEPPSKPSKKIISTQSPPIKTAQKPTAAKKSVKTTSKTVTSNKENDKATTNKPSKKRKAIPEFSASPPRSSPPPESPKRKPSKKPDFHMTPFLDKSTKNQLSLIPLSPPSSKLTSETTHTDHSVPIQDEPAKPKKKRKLLGGVRTLMDDTPKKSTVKTTNINFGKDLSPLKRPVSGSGLIVK